MMPHLRFPLSTMRPFAAVSVRLCLALILCLMLARPTSAQSAVHVVQPGETLSQIALNYGVSTSALSVANSIANTNHVWVGQRLTIPSGGGNAHTSSASGGTVTVGRGDSLSVIAAMYGTSTQDLMALNGLSNPNHIWVGQRLRVSGSASASSYSAPAATSGNVHIVQYGETLSQIAQYYGTTTGALLAANGLSNPNHVYVGQRLAVRGGGHALSDKSSFGPKKIVVDLSNQTLTAWQGETVVLYTSISSGTAAYPTVTGHFRIDRKYQSQRMTGADYDIPNVPWVMYFWSGYAFHGAYWHNNFGVPMSHGCIHLRPGEAQWLYSWADVGTDVFVNW